MIMGFFPEIFFKCHITFAGMLQLFVDRQICRDLLNRCGRLVDESEVEVRPEKLPDAAHSKKIHNS